MKAFSNYLIVLMVVLGCGTASAEEIAFFIADTDTSVVHEAITKVHLPDGLTVSMYTPHDFTEDEASFAPLKNADVIVVDVMFPDVTELLLKHIDPKTKKVYAVGGSRNDEELKERGIVFDKDIKNYFYHLDPKNVQNLVRKVANLEFDRFILYEKVKQGPTLGLYHPDAESLFEKPEKYLEWYRKRPDYDPDAPVVAVMMYTAWVEVPGQIEHVATVIRKLEKAGFSVMGMFGWDPDLLTNLATDENGKPYMDAAVAFSLKFQSALDERVFESLRKLDVPIFNLLNLYYSTIKEWRADPRGIAPIEVGWSIANPEISGLLEPTAASGKVKYTDEKTGKDVYIHEAIEDNLDVLIPRITQWIDLQRKPNKDKKVVIIIYNNSRGKQNIGASYLNVFGSLELILKRLKQEGYTVESDGEMTKERIRDLILAVGRNVGSWAPGELERMLAEGNVARLPVETYKKWFDNLPEDFRKEILEQWGPVEKSDIMIKNGKFVMPGVRFGNVTIVPEPARGYTDDPMMLYHSETLFPHHQYIAAYLWMKYVFNADAQIHLGTHGTHEWLPGKQAGLSPSCPPDVLITDIPSLYPYIVDDVGEGTQAKRRGRAEVVDHLIPAVREAGTYQEYTKLQTLFSDYFQALSAGSATAEVRRKQIEVLVEQLGIDKDVDLSEINEDTMPKLHGYLHEIEANFMPYGLHTFGRAPEAKALEDTVLFILQMHHDRDGHDITRRLEQSGPLELDRLVAGLEGRYVPPGTGNDPFRNPKAIPTGKNFYGFDPAKIPTKAAYELGVRAADDIIKRSLEREERYPEKVAVVLWATETIRNEGVNEATILHLLGMKPVWDAGGRVKDVQAVPGVQLNRPRIDVLIDASGLYRDLFPNIMQYLDKAVQKAVVLTDVENLIRKNSDRIKVKLIESGMPEEQAEKLSRLRVFSEKPGNYGNRVSEMVTAPGLWEKNDEIAKVFEKQTGYAFGETDWGVSAKDAFKANLKQSDVAVHSISSTVYGTMDNDDMFQYLGGLSLAIAKQRGKAPDTVVSLQRRPDNVTVESLEKTVGRELRSRYLNPKWIEGMKKEDYAGAREMSNFVEYMFGWQVTTPFAVDEAKWQQTYEVYVEDKYGMELKEFFDKANPWAYQSITAHMLETVRKGFWKADEKVKQKLAAEYAVSVVDKGIACCDHTCNNPAMNQMVVSLISVPGVLSPEIAEQFKLAVEKATQQRLEEQAKAIEEKRKQALEGFDKPTPPGKPESEQEKASTKASEKQVEGYKMEDMNTQDETSQLPSSGAQWYAFAFVIAILALTGLGIVLRSNRERKHR